MNTRVRVLVLLLTAWVSNLAWASCFGPGVSVHFTTDAGVAIDLYPFLRTVGGVRTEAIPALAAGTEVSLRGSAFMDACNDVCVNGVCPPTFPAKGIKLLFIQGDKTVELGRVDANSDFKFSLKATLPADATSGPATILAETLYGRRLMRTEPIAITIAAKR